MGGTILHLLDHQIAPYRYDHAHPATDQFTEIIERLLTHDHLILASPVYWYSMSGGMKNFLDRFSDLLQIHKERGRQLRGKKLGVLSCSAEPIVNAGFYEPFRLTAAYLGMTYAAPYHVQVLATGQLSLKIT
jgi:NAD(P)H-dependent FMN reductase